MPSREVALGLAYARAGQTESRRHHARRAPPSAIPIIRYAYVALGRVWLEIAQARNDRVALSKAIDALEGAVGSDDSSEALTLFGRALLLTSDEETAERMLQDATQKQPVEPLAFYYLADAAERLGALRRRAPALLDYEVLRGDDGRAPAQRRTPTRLGDLSLRLERARRGRDLLPPRRRRHRRRAARARRRRAAARRRPGRRPRHRGRRRWSRIRRTRSPDLQRSR